jgi:hypothetical protein
MKNNLILSFFLFFSALLYGQSQNTREWSYELEGISALGDGKFVVKIWSYTKKPKLDYNDAKRNAIHGLIFKGYVRKGNIPALPPLSNIPGLEQTQIDFFNQFFRDGGDYLKYIAVSNENLAIGAGDLIKLNKGYKIGMIVTVDKNLLKRDLEAAGIIKSLNSGF